MNDQWSLFAVRVGFAVGISLVCWFSATDAAGLVVAVAFSVLLVGLVALAAYLDGEEVVRDPVRGRGDPFGK